MILPLPVFILRCSVKLWASAFGGEMKSIAAKYSGSQLLQKVHAQLIHNTYQLGEHDHKKEWVIKSNNSPYFCCLQSGYLKENNKMETELNAN